ncbi:hypothetical protein JZX86_27610 [Agrobacterium rosae]|uniref:hypothetical protein n=1 Tax=Agrobacterium rosae TaxID=1972867 RepID=UPI0019D410E0|nr:hypothetical protein [Agrobacterium rosae]MBN7809090.1 hypothetical protein [Agrobacterium rosae]
MENIGLNLIGDSLAGFMALVTLLVVAGSFAHQIEQSKQAVRDMRKQNELNASIANANLKLGLYEKRLAVYTTMREINQRVAINGTVHVDEARDIFNAVDAAKFIYPTEVNTYLNQMGTIADEIIRLQFRIDRQQRKMNLATLTQEELAELDVWYTRQSDLEDELFARGSFVRIDQVFTPHLTVPHEIAVAA